MARRRDPDYVTGAAGRFEVQPPIVHPAWCTCDRCAEIAIEERGREHVVRVRRQSPHPASRVQSAAFAFDLKKQLERELRSAQSQTRPAGVMMLAELCELYFEMNPRKVSAATIARDRISAGNLVRLLPAHVAPDAIDEPIAVRYRNAREKEGAAQRTILNELSFLKMMLGFGLRWKTETGMTGIQLYELPAVAETTPPGIALSVDEVGRILEIASARERRLVITGITTMLRRRPLMSFRRTWVDFERRWLSVPAEFMKKGRSRSRLPLEIPLSKWTVAELKKSEPSRAGFYWSNVRTDEPIGRVFQILSPLATRAKVRAFSLHDLRTTGATWLSERGVDERAIGMLLGHRSTFDPTSGTFHAIGQNVTRGYTKVFESTLREAVATFDEIRKALK
jgi:integrase